MATFITTESGADLLTESDLYLITETDLGGNIATIWRPTNGIGELGNGPNLPITTENSLEITTESGKTLVIENGTFADIPKTVWFEDDSM